MHRGVTWQVHCISADEYSAKLQRWVCSWKKEGLIFPENRCIDSQATSSIIRSEAQTILRTPSIQDCLRHYAMQLTEFKTILTTVQSCKSCQMRYPLQQTIDIASLISPQATHYFTLFVSILMSAQIQMQGIARCMQKQCALHEITATHRCNRLTLGCSQLAPAQHRCKWLGTAGYQHKQWCRHSRQWCRSSRPRSSVRRSVRPLRPRSGHWSRRSWGRQRLLHSGRFQSGCTRMRHRRCTRSLSAPAVIQAVPTTLITSVKRRVLEILGFPAERDEK